MIELDQAGSGLLSAITFKPPPDLSPWIEYLWAQAYPPDREERDWLVVPDASSHILVQGFAGGRCRARLIGPRSRAVRFRLADRRWTVGVRFRPGALPSLVGGPAGELVDAGIPLEDVSQIRPERLQERIRDGFADETVPLLLSVLRRRFRDQEPPSWKIRAFLRASRQSGNGERVGKVASRLGMGSRTLRRASLDGIGLSPKSVLRVRRAQRAALRMVYQAENPSRVAHLEGYSDQAHLSRDFGALFGESPSTYLRRRTEGRFFQAAAPMKDELGRILGIEVHRKQGLKVDEQDARNAPGPRMGAVYPLGPGRSAPTRHR